MSDKFVSIVGAGCGEKDLITLRGLNRIRSCEVLIYDDLIDEALLNELPESAERIYMGKRLNKHSAKQEEINACIVSKALEGKRVVRLKGGDPFVFGRGGEECQALIDSGIDFELVPGLSSSIAIPELSGIPVTHRGLSRGFHVVTAHTADTEDGLPEYIDKMACLDVTLVFLMGLSRLDKICKRLITSGMRETMPAAVVSGGNSPNPATVRGNLLTISEKVKEAQVKAPAVIIVGETAALDFSSREIKPLNGAVVALTGTESVTSKLQGILSGMGASVFTAQSASLVELPFEFDLASLSDNKPKTLVFTSANGVNVFFKRLKEQKFDLRRLNSCGFAVIGKATAAALEGYGIYADICPEVYTSEALAEKLISTVSPDNEIFLFRSAEGSEPLYNKLSAFAKTVDVPTYTVKAEADIPEALRERLNTADYLLFSSSGGVKSFFNEFEGIPEGIRCACIGEVTAKTLAGKYDKPFITAEAATAQSLAEAIKNDFKLK
ncbi:MAG: uroporphyrinogen-III C-methyltransferase [Bacillota bacterium]|nr:uroporphyrinogen-III C-methyltransferase [Bacillota bacterium]